MPIITISLNSSKAVLCPIFRKVEAAYSAIFFIICSLFFIFAPGHAIVSLALPFSDHMVLQRNLTVPIWGQADPHESITVRFRGQTKVATAKSDGKWRVNLDATSEGGPFELVVNGDNTLNLSDIMVGEVWIASGQSNMQFSILNIGGPNLDSIKSAELPNLRFINVQESNSWIRCDPSVALNLSATSYYFGLELQRTLKVPVGLIIGAEGATPLERWMDPISLANDSLLKSDTSSQKGDLFRKFIQPLAPFAIKGFIWYQGESNAQFTWPAHPNWTVKYYRERFKAMITGWRTHWNQGDIPFCFAQIANYSNAQTDPGENSAWAELREAQRLNLILPNTSMAVLIDIGDAINIHPINKWGVGKRLSLPILSKSYGAKNLEWSGPAYQSIESKGKTVRIVFSHAQGLTARNSATGLQSRRPLGFAISGKDKKWVWADATIINDTVIVTGSDIEDPTMVRYGWANNPNCNLFNSSGLPASPFQIKVTQANDAYSFNSIARAPKITSDLPILKLSTYSRNALGRKLSLTNATSHKGNRHLKLGTNILSKTIH